MSFWKSRLKRLEARQRQKYPDELAHFIATVEVPWEHDTTDYLAQLRCPCGAVDCPEKRFGLVVVRRCQTTEEWQARVAAYREGRHKPPMEISNADLTVILNRVEGKP
jgi:hypothetical protein